MVTLWSCLRGSRRVGLQSFQKLISSAQDRQKRPVFTSECLVCPELGRAPTTKEECADHDHSLAADAIDHVKALLALAMDRYCAWLDLALFCCFISPQLPHPLLLTLYIAGSHCKILASLCLSLNAEQISSHSNCLLLRSNGLLLFATWALCLTSLQTRVQREDDIFIVYNSKFE